MKNILLLLLIPALLESCSTRKKIFGSYVTNFASNGFFITYIELHSDSTFLYGLTGDLSHQVAKGTYTISNRKLYLCEEYEAADTSGFSELISLGLDSAEFYEMRQRMPIRDFFFLKRGKLFFNRDGDISKTAVRHTSRLSRRKDMWYISKHYLMKIDTDYAAYLKKKLEFNFD